MHPVRRKMFFALCGCIALFALIFLAGCGGAGTTTPPPVATHLSVSAPATVTAGTAFSVTVSALDSSGAVVSTYSGKVHLTSTDAQAVLPADSTLTNGTGTFSVTLKTAAGQQIAATDTVTASISGTSAGITVNAGPATTVSIQVPSAETIGLTFQITVNVADAYGNVATSYAGTVHFTSTDSLATLPGNTTLTNGSGTFSMIFKTIGNQTITASDTVTASLKGTSSAINVVSNAATHFGVAAPGSTTTRATFNLNVTALDGAGNTSAGYTGTVHFTSTDSNAILPANSTLSNGAGSFSATLETAGNQTITATDTATASITGASNSVSVTAAAALTITSGAPPNGTFAVNYGPTEYLQCHWNFFRGTFLVCGPCTISTGCSSLPTCRNNIPTTGFCKEVIHGFPLTATGGVQPYRWSASGLPPGVILNSSNRLTGNPTSPGTYTVTVTLSDSGTPQVSPLPTSTYTIVINDPPPPTINATPAPPSGVVNLPYSFTFTASSTAPPLTWRVSAGTPPAGLTFTSNGLLSGTPTAIGTSSITLIAQDSFKQDSAAQQFNIQIFAHGFVATGSMGTARRFHTATLLGSGKVLVAGGEDAFATAFASAELYDPTTGTFSPTGNMTVPRVGHTATLLSSGKVLITGGATDQTENALSSAELYDPAAGTFSTTAGSMASARVSHTATLLKGGKVLVVGGDVIFYNGISNTSIHSLASAEIFDPSTGTFTATGSLSAARESHTATLLNDGRVLVAGGSDGAVGNTTPAATIYATAELFDPTKGTFTAAGMMTSGRDFFTATLLGSGKVLAAGGISSTAGFLGTADLFDPTSTSFAATGNLTAPRFYHDATTLNGGTVLLTGGADANDRALATAEIYDPTAGTFASTGSMLSVRVWHTATLLPNGKVLVTGGADNNSIPLATAELYQ